MSIEKRIVCFWLTPKIFDDLTQPADTVRKFFDHHREWLETFPAVVVNFCTGSGDHILNYSGDGATDETFDWGRYSCYVGDYTERRQYNQDWLHRVRDGAENSFNPYMTGPSLILNDEPMSYRKLEGIYAAFRSEAHRRGLDFKLLEYLDPGPEFCYADWKTRHAEASAAPIDFPGAVVHQGPIDVLNTLHADDRRYALCPSGIAEGMNVGDFVIGQVDRFTHDMGLDGVYLGNQFALPGFWEPDKAPTPTPQRRAGIAAFFKKFRESMGNRLVYWMDTYWPVEVEIEKWSMSLENYAQLDAVMISNFAVIVERNQIPANIESRLRATKQLGGRPANLFSFDFVDPWYWYRIFNDDKRIYQLQRDLYRRFGSDCHGVSFFANDTYGHYVPESYLAETLKVIRDTHSAS